MALRIRFQYPSGSTLGYSVERLADGAYLDFADASGKTFSAAPTILIAPLPEDIAPFKGRYKATLAPTPFADGDYVVTVHDLADADTVVAELAATLKDGDDASYHAPRLGAFLMEMQGFTAPAYAVPAYGFSITPEFQPPIYPPVPLAVPTSPPATTND